jgi:hypothetical protein
VVRIDVTRLHLLPLAGALVRDAALLDIEYVDVLVGTTVRARSPRDKSIPKRAPCLCG